MHFARSLGTTALILAALPAAAQVEPLADPIPDPILKGDLVVEATPFVRAPRTADSAVDAMTNEAYARIQYLTPVGDGSGRLVLNDLRGLLYITDENGAEPVIYMDVRTLDIGFDDSMFPNETGLVGVAFHPQFAAAGTPGFGKFYTAYSARSDSGTADYLDDDAGSHESVIREWTVGDPAANAFSGTSREVFRIGQFAPNHNVGTIAFNPNAAPGSPEYGLLYASLGDAGAAHDPRDFGQSLAAPHGAIIRIDPLGGDGSRGYGVPADNPFVGEAGVAPEIWAYGLRHAQQFSWDTDGRMFMGDIGQNVVEEVNLGVPGANYGWRLRERHVRHRLHAHPPGDRDPCTRPRPRTTIPSCTRWPSTTTTRATPSAAGSSTAARPFPSCRASTSSPTSRAAGCSTSTPTGSCPASSPRSGSCGWSSTAKSATSSRRPGYANTYAPGDPGRRRPPGHRLRGRATICLTKSRRLRIRKLEPVGGR